MADTIPLSPKPEIKCYAGNHKICETWFDDTADETLEKVRKLAEEWLWTDESTHCICYHHVKQHCTVRDRCGRVVNIHCHGSNELCNCELFRTRSIRIDLLGNNSYDKTVTEDFADV